MAKLLELKKLAADLENPTQEATPDAKKQGEAQREGGGAKPTQDVGVTPKSEDFARWYLDVIRECELADYGPARGTMVIRPYGYALWEGIQSWMDKRFKETGVENAYFPQLIPYSFITKEASHVEGFAPSSQSSRKAVARAGGAARRAPHVGDDREPHVLAVDPVLQGPAAPDEPVGERAPLGDAHEALSSHARVSVAGGAHCARDGRRGGGGCLSRWSTCTPKFAEDIAAMPVIVGRKSAVESFAGANRTYTIEAMMGDRRALQAGTSHNLGQNFAKAFDTQFLDETGAEAVRAPELVGRVHAPDRRDHHDPRRRRGLAAAPAARTRAGGGGAHRAEEQGQGERRRRRRRHRRRAQRRRACASSWTTTRATRRAGSSTTGR